jgi:hypothetical protein
MNDPASSDLPKVDRAEGLEAEINEAIALCGGKVRAALRATLIANAFLQAEVERLCEAVSSGFARGRIRRPAKRGNSENKAGSRLRSRRCPLPIMSPSPSSEAIRSKQIPRASFVTRGLPRSA